MPTNYVSKISDGTNTYDIKDANAVHTVDQTYDDTSANPQSGVALKSVIDGLQDYIEAEEAARISEDNSLATDISDLGTNLINERNMRIAQDNALYGEILDVKLSFSPELADEAEKFNFHPTQKIKKEQDGTLTVTFKASGNKEIMWHVFKWGAGCKILAPKTLKDEYKQYLQEVLNNY